MDAGTQHVIQAASPGKTRLEHPGEHYHLGKADQDVWKRRQKQEADSGLSFLNCGNTEG